MRSVWIAGSVNMDIVAAAVRHPKIGETVAGREVFFFPGGKGANQAVAAAKLGAPTALIGKVGDDAFGRELRQFLAAQNVDLKFLRDTAEAHTGHAVITVADADNSIVVVPGANTLLSERDVAGPVLDRGDVAGQSVGIPLPTARGLLLQGAIRRRHDHPQSGAGRGVQPRLARPRRHPRSERDRAWRDCRHRGRRERFRRSHCRSRTHAAGGETARAFVVTLGRRGAVAWAQGRSAHHSRRRPWKAGTRPAPATASSERSLRKPRSAYRLRRP